MQDNPIIRAIEQIRNLVATGLTHDEAARILAKNNVFLVFDVRERIGSYPASEPELRAIQKL